MACGSRGGRAGSLSTTLGSPQYTPHRNLCLAPPGLPQPGLKPHRPLPCLALLWIPCPRSVPNSVISSFPAQLLVSPRGLPHHLQVWLRAAWSCQCSVSICLPTGRRVLRRREPRWHCALLSPGPHTVTVHRATASVQGCVGEAGWQEVLRKPDRASVPEQGCSGWAMAPPLGRCQPLGWPGVHGLPACTHHCECH